MIDTELEGKSKCVREKRERGGERKREGGESDRKIDRRSDSEGT